MLLFSDDAAFEAHLEDQIAETRMQTDPVPQPTLRKWPARYEKTLATEGLQRDPASRAWSTRLLEGVDEPRNNVLSDGVRSVFGDVASG